MARIGDFRWRAVMVCGTVQYSKHVLRTIRQHNGVQLGFMVEHVHGVTWVKLSRKHKDWGYAKNIHAMHRTRFRVDAGLPYSATKAGALRVLAAELRSDIDKYGANEKLWDDEPLSLGEELKKVISAQRRLKLGLKPKGKAAA